VSDHLLQIRDVQQSIPERIISVHYSMSCIFKDKKQTRLFEDYLNEKKEVFLSILNSARVIKRYGEIIHIAPSILNACARSKRVFSLIPQPMCRGRNILISTELEVLWDPEPFRTLWSRVP